MNQILSASKDQRNIERQLANALISSRAFGRLFEVSFLGSIDYFNSHRSSGSTKQFSRADHALGVLGLSERLIEQIEIDDLSRRYVVAVALCHDLAHSPFSHSTERAYKKIDSSIDHKKVLRFVLSDAEFGISGLLDGFGLDADRVYEISVRKNDSLSWIFHNPINVDTLDGISRFLQSFMLVQPFDADMVIDSLAKLHNKMPISSNEISNIDIFWSIKSSFYENFLTSGVYADFENSYIDRIISNKDCVLISDYLAKDSDIVSVFDGLLVNGPRRVGKNKRRRPHFDLDLSFFPSSIDDLHGRYVRNEKNDGVSKSR